MKLNDETMVCTIDTKSSTYVIQPSNNTRKKIAIRLDNKIMIEGEDFEVLGEIVSAMQWTRQDLSDD